MISAPSSIASASLDSHPESSQCVASFSVASAFQIRDGPLCISTASGIDYFSARKKSVPWFRLAFGSSGGPCDNLHGGCFKLSPACCSKFKFRESIFLGSEKLRENLGHLPDPDVDSGRRRCPELYVAELRRWEAASEI